MECKAQKETKFKWKQNFTKKETVAYYQNLQNVIGMIMTTSSFKICLKTQSNHNHGICLRILLLLQE